ncbi:MAG TPA: hypothetical protein VGD40_02420 [Chryseosolibacter sp.]
MRTEYQTLKDNQTTLVIRLVEAARKLIYAAHPDVHERAIARLNTLAFSLRPDRSTEFCSIICHSRHITLCFHSNGHNPTQRPKRARSKQVKVSTVMEIYESPLLTGLFAKSIADAEQSDVVISNSNGQI